MNAISDSDEKTWPPGAATPGADCDSKLGDVSMSSPLSGSTAEVLVPSAAMEPPAAHMSHLAPNRLEAPRDQRSKSAIDIPVTIDCADRPSNDGDQKCTKCKDEPCTSHKVQNESDPGSSSRQGCGHEPIGDEAWVVPPVTTPMEPAHSAPCAPPQLFDPPNEADSKTYVYDYPGDAVDGDVQTDLDKKGQAESLPFQVASLPDTWPVWQVVLLAIFVGCVYGVPSTVIPLSSSMLGRQHWNVTMQLNTLGRVLGCTAIAAIEAYRGKLTQGQDGLSLLDKRGWTVASVAALHTSMFIPLHFLVSLGDVSVLLALTSLYSVVPPLYGILRGGETVTRLKIAGLSAAALAVVLLSTASATGGSGDSDSGSPALAACLVVVTILGWGTTDTVFSKIGKTMPPTSVALWFAVGNAVFSLALAQVGAAVRQVTLDPASITSTPTAEPSDASADGSILGYFALLGTNILAMGGWYGFIVLGGVADASTFVPIVAAIFTVTPTVIGTAFLGERFTALMGVGAAFAMAAAVCMALQDREAPHSKWQLGHSFSRGMDEDPANSESGNGKDDAATACAHAPYTSTPAVPREVVTL